MTKKSKAMSKKTRKVNTSKSERAHKPLTSRRHPSKIESHFPDCPCNTKNSCQEILSDTKPFNKSEIKMFHGTKRDLDFTIFEWTCECGRNRIECTQTPLLQCIVCNGMLTCQGPIPGNLTDGYMAFNQDIFDTLPNFHLESMVMKEKQMKKYMKK